MAWILAVVLAVGCWLLLEKFTNIPHDAKEPPLIPQSVPYVGHLLGMLRDGSRYYTSINARFSLAIYTLRVPRSKIYIVNSPSLVAAVDRHSKVVSFAPYVVQFAKRMLLPSPEGLDALAANLHEEDGAWGCRPETLKVMHLALAPGKNLDHSTQDMLDSVSCLLDSVCTIANNEGFGLFSWVKKLVTRASTDAIYGASKNPFQDPAVEAGFWAIDKDFAFLGLNILPNIIAPRGHRGRKTLFQGFQKYYAHDGHKAGSRLVQARYEVNRKYNVSIDDIEHFDLSVCYGLLVNTVPATAWVLYYIYSRPSLLEEVRSTLSSYLHDSSDPSDGLTHQVNIAEIVAGYPLLSSLVQETLRVQSTNASGRVVLKDTLLDGQYLLKQGSILLIPSAELHSNASIWGPSVKDFDPRRFMQKRTPEAKVPASAYRAYGSGDSVCPGRYLAANEIMMVLVIMVLKYDLSPVQERWVMPESRSHITTSILTPTKDIQVTMTERKKYKHCSWKFVWSGSGLSSEPSL